MKKIIKRILGKIQIIKSGIKNSGENIYIGLHTKICNGKKIHLEKNVKIMPYNMLVPVRDGKITIKEGAEIGMFSRITASNNVVIGKNVITGPNIFISDYNHEYKNIDIPIKSQGINQKTNGKINQVIIGDNCWIGTNVTIVGNVNIGKHCVIGANTVVTKNIEDYSVVAGNPCKVIKRYNKDTKKWERKT